MLTILVDKVKCGVGVYFSRICEDNFNSNLVHVVDLDLGVRDHSDGHFQVKSSAFRTLVPYSIILIPLSIFRKQVSIGAFKGMIDFTCKSLGSKTAHFSCALMIFFKVLSAVVKYCRRRQYLKPRVRA